jgi:hypothetical protein
MIAVRPFEPGDLEGVLSLHRESFPGVRQRPPEEVARKYRSLFVEGPLIDPSLPPLVACGENGRIVGFRSTLIRSWNLRGKKVIGRTGTGLAVHPEVRGRGIEHELREVWQKQREAVHGRASFGLSDRLTPDAIRLSKKRLKPILDLYAIGWAIPVRRRAARLRHLEGALTRRVASPRGIRRAFRAIGRYLEQAMRDSAPELPQAPGFREVPLSGNTLREALCSVGEGHPLRLDEDSSTLEWLIDYMRDYPSRGRLHGAILARREAPEGFYLGYLRSSRDFEVVALGARSGSGAAVFAHLLRDAYAQGAVSALGTVSASDLRVPLEFGARIHTGFTADLTTQDEEIKKLFVSGKALVTGLEAEAWI